MSSKKLECNIPDPLTGEEDASMAITIWATSPMNMCIHKMLKTKCIEVEHAQIHNYLPYIDTINYHTQRKQHTFIQALIQHVHHNH